MTFHPDTAAQARRFDAAGAPVAPGIAATERRSAWRTIRKVAPYLWPRDKPWVKRRVVVAMAMLAIAKLVAVGTPSLYNAAVDVLVGPGPGPGAAPPRPPGRVLVARLAADAGCIDLHRSARPPAVIVARREADAVRVPTAGLASGPFGLGRSSPAAHCRARHGRARSSKAGRTHPRRRRRARQARPRSRPPHAGGRRCGFRHRSDRRPPGT